MEVMTSSLALSTDEIEQFAEAGFVVVRQITDDSTLQRIRGRILDLFAARTGREEGALFDFAGTDLEGEAMRLPQLLDVRTYAPELMATTYFENASAIARQLLGCEARLVADHALFKPALSGASTPWHQDDAFRADPYEHQEISIWLALQKTDHSNGCLAFVPGSHKQPILPHRTPDGDGRVHALECVEGWSQADIIECPLSAGDCTIHTNRTLHGAGPNGSGEPRYGYVLVFGTPPKKLSSPPFRPWLANKQELRFKRRRAWLRRGGLVVHCWRRARQIRQIGVRESARRLQSRLFRPNINLP